MDQESEKKPAQGRPAPGRKAVKPAGTARAAGGSGGSAREAAKPATGAARAAKPATGAARTSPVGAGAEAAKSTTRKPAARRPAVKTPATTAARTSARTGGASRKPAASTQRPAAPTARREPRQIVLTISDLTKRFGQTLAVDHISLEVPAGSIFGIVGPNGAGKTTTLSMVTGLLRPDSGTITVHGANVWADPVAAKRKIGVLPDRLRLFDRLSGSQLLFYAGTLRGLDAATVRERSADLAVAFGLEDALGRLVADYSAGMTKKIALACAMIHSPRLLVLDEPFESVDPVSAANVTEILRTYAAAGGTVVLSSHSMDLIQRICDFVAIVVSGSVLAAGTTDEVRGSGSLEDRFVELVGGRTTAEGMEWLHSFSD